MRISTYDNNEVVIVSTSTEKANHFYEEHIQPTKRRLENSGLRFPKQLKITLYDSIQQRNQLTTIRESMRKFGVPCPDLVFLTYDYDDEMSVSLDVFDYFEDDRIPQDWITHEMSILSLKATIENGNGSLEDFSKLMLYILSYYFCGETDYLKMIRGFQTARGFELRHISEFNGSSYESLYSSLWSREPDKCSYEVLDWITLMGFAKYLREQNIEFDLLLKIMTDLYNENDGSVQELDPIFLKRTGKRFTEWDDDYIEFLRNLE